MSFYSEKVLSLSPTHYYKLDEASGTTAADSAGALPGTYTGTVTLAQPGPLNLGAAAQFQGSGTSYVPISTNTDTALNSTAFTYALWLNLHTVNTTATVSGLFTITNASAFDKYLRIDGGGNNQKVEIGFTDSGGTVRALVSSSAISLDTWTFIAASFATNSLATTINTTRTTSAITATPRTTTGMEASIAGRFELTNNWQCDGKIAHFAIFNTALTQQNLLDLYNTAIADPGHPAALPPALQAMTRSSCW